MPHAMQRFSRAYAKINIGLHIKNRRPDGYHELETVLHTVDLCDDLVLEPAQSITVLSSSPLAPSDTGNLCHKAARLLAGAAGCSDGVRIALRKRIPVGAGLGGGSSDAAAVLRELPLLWGVDVDDHLLNSLALQLGSDVPYFLQPGSALATGRGERLEYFPLDIPYTVLLVTPDIHVSTAWAYSQIVPAPGRSLPPLRSAVVSGMNDPARLRREVRNDFEEPVFAAYPAIGELKRKLLDYGALFALMSGSGSSVYGLFGSAEAASRAAGSLGDRVKNISFTAPSFQPAPSSHASATPTTTVS